MLLTDAKLLEILCSTSEAVVIYEGEDFRIRFISERMLGYWGMDSRVIGKTLDEIFGKDSKLWFIGKVREIWQTGQSFKTSNIPAEVKVDQVYGIVHFDVEMEACFNEKGHVYAVIHRGWPINKEKEAQLGNNKKIEKRLLQDLLRRRNEFSHLIELDNSSLNNLLDENNKADEVHDDIKSAVSKIIIREEQFNLALKAAKIGIWILYFDKNKVVWDEITQQMLGFENINTLTLEEAMQGILPADRGKIANKIAKTKLHGSDGSYEVSFRTKWKERNEIRWINNKGKVYFDEHGEPLWLIGVSSDVTERMEQEQKLQVYHQLVVQKEKELRMVIDAAAIGTFGTSKYLDAIYFNSNAQIQFGFDPTVALDFKQFLGFFTHNYRRPLYEAFYQLVTNNVSVDMLCEIENKQTKTHVWVRLVATQYVDDQQEHYIQGVIIDLTQAKEDMQRKLDFISIASHELKTPLTTILTFLQLLQQRYDMFDKVKKKEMIQQALDEGQRMKSLIDGFLNVSKLQNGQLDLDKSSFRINELILKVKEMYVVLESENRILFNINSDIIVHGDKHKIEGVILNFINNAIKYSPQNSFIHVDVYENQGSIWISVKDQGPGIPVKDQPHIFDKFYRVNRKENETVQGFGIGLYISSEIIKQHGGKIGLNSNYGDGSEFWFSLPLYQKVNV